MISVVVLTYNESVNIERVLESVAWVDEIIIVDSYSTDRTLEITQKYPRVKIHKRRFDNHTNQWNFGISKAKNDWILSLDADYIVSDPLRKEISDIILHPKFIAYSIPFKYLVQGKPLTGTILPPRVALFDKKHCTYIQDGHTQMLQSNGEIGTCKKHIFHDDRKKLDRWIWAQYRYAELEIDKLFNDEINLSLVDRIRKRKLFTPFLIFFYCLFFKGAIFDGKRGIYYSYQRMYFELLLSLKVIDKEFDKS